MGLIVFLVWGFCTIFFLFVFCLECIIDLIYPTATAYGILFILSEFETT